MNNGQLVNDTESAIFLHDGANYASSHAVYAAYNTPDDRGRTVRYLPRADYRLPHGMNGVPASGGHTINPCEKMGAEVMRCIQVLLHDDMRRGRIKAPRGERNLGRRMMKVLDHFKTSTSPKVKEFFASTLHAMAKHRDDILAANGGIVD